MKQYVCALITVGVMLLAASVSTADEYLWDQMNDLFPPSIYRDIGTFSSFGQGFTPNLDYLEVVQLKIQNFSADTCEITVNIHSNSITGPLIGSSSTTTISDPFSTHVATFIFESIPLLPQNLYVMEFFQTRGYAGVAGYSPATYPEGCAILWGIPYDNIDNWFREGVFEQTALERLTWGSLKNLCW